MIYQDIKLQSDNQIAHLTLTRPEFLNALTPNLISEMSLAVDEISDDESVKALVIRGDGRSFCAGADLIHLEKAFQHPHELRSFLWQTNEVFFKLEGMPIPVIAAVHGYCLAGGLELALSCDIMIVSNDAQIGDQHTNFGLMPGGGSTQRLTRKIGHQRAIDLIFTGRRITGVEASELGLALSSVSPNELDLEVEGLLTQLRGKSRTGMAWIKSTVNRGLDISLREGISIEIDSFVEYCTTSPHPKEGIKAFKERRLPSF